MTALRSRAARTAAAVAVQLALVSLAVAGPLSARLTGEEYVLDVAPVDPIDPFRGAYVALSYPGLPQPAEIDPDGADSHGDRDVYVPLVRSGEVWKSTGIETERPQSGPYLRCVDDGWQLRCGIESLFLPQDEALAMERDVQAGSAVARIKVDSRGNAALVDVQRRG